MAAEKTPVLLVLSVRTDRQQWFLTEVTLEGKVTPLVRSEPENLQPHLGGAFDDRLSFLRHRLAGALQRGCDRLWGRSCKAARVVILTDGDLDPSAPELNQALADHFCLWMSRPPVTFLQSPARLADPQRPTSESLAGQLDAEQQSALDHGLAELAEAMQTPERWEVIPQPHTS